MDAMTQDHVMIDLETAGTLPTSAILSIGAVKFSRSGISTEDTFYVPTDLPSCVGVGLTVCAESMEWWGRQSQEARAVFHDPRRVHIQHALLEFAAWLPYDAKVWGNGAAFDNVILANAYRACRLEVPWQFYNDRCYRTLAAHFPRRTQLGTHHNALDDAMSQATHLLENGAWFVK